jgi:cytosine/adenosine deaminase-related metal-dependent hydrolase
MDPRATVLEGVDLLVEGGRIARIAPSIPAPAGARTLDAIGAYVLPGLIQGHVHLGQTLFRGLAEERRLLAWLRERIWPLEAAHDDESAYWSGLLGAAECLLGGTTTIQEIGIGPEADALLAAIAESGLRAFAGKCLMDQGEGLPARLAEETEACLAETEALADRWHGAGDGRIRYALNPRFVLSCSPALLEGVRDLAERRGFPVHTHALEQRDETALVRRLFGGRDEIELFGDLGLLDGDLRIAHGVWIRPRHYAELARRRFSVCHCPGSNLKLGSGIARVVRLRGAGIPVSIGADGPPCNNRLDPWEEIRLAARLQALREGPGALPGVEALRLATSEGARALSLDSEIGTLETGRTADLTVVALDRPELATAPQVDPHDRLVYGASPAAVRHVVVAGELLVEEGRLTRLDLDEILREAAKAADRVARRAGI